MLERSIEQIKNMIKIENDVSRFNDRLIRGVAFDSRLIKQGNLFVPLVSEKADGHDYVPMAFEKGASAVLWQKDRPNPPENVPVLIVEDTLQALQDLAHSYRNQVAPKVLGITGSNGKTTTKDIAAAVLSEKYRVHKTDGNFNNHIGLPITILNMKEDTEVVVLEMGMSNRGEISLLTKIARPDVAIITNIGEAHLQDLGSRDGIAEAKLEITEGLRENGLLIFPGAERLLTEKVKQLKHIRIQTFGNLKSDLYADDVNFDEKGSTFTIPHLTETPFELPLAGKHNIGNALAVILAALEFSLTSEEIRTGLKAVQLSEMRMEWHEGIKGTLILNDAYNASPTSMRAVLSMFTEMEREKIVILGDMLELGPEEREYHVQIGEELDPRKIKYVFTYGELGNYIGEGAKKNFEEDHVFSFMDQDELVSKLTEVIVGKELILLKASRGVQLENILPALTETK